MSFAIIYSRANVGVHARQVTVEVDIANGLPRLSIVGLPETAVKESKDRVRSALLNSQFEFPAKRITVNLAPANLPKEGTRFDLPIALGILAASNQLPKTTLAEYEFVGELALSGELRAIDGVLPFVIAAKHNKRTLILPQGNAHEAALVTGICVYPATHILDICAHIMDKKKLSPCRARILLPPQNALDLADVKGQQYAKHALEIAAAGGHSLLMVGPPGTGKSMLANRLPGILPALSEEMALEQAALQSISANPIDTATWLQPKIRMPHHTASAVALVGGGKPPAPGEISLAHNGVLFLDELPEFPRHVLETLREPLESGKINISRAGYQAEFPANFQLIAAMNPCPCGYLNDKNSQCHCSPEQISRYRNRLSGPLLDRIDMHITVLNISKNELLIKTIVATKENSASVRTRVIDARDRQLSRGQILNAKLSGQALEKHCQLSDSALKLLKQAMVKMQLSARGCHRVLRVARTIADLAVQDNISKEHISQALQYRVRIF